MAEGYWDNSPKSFRIDLNLSLIHEDLFKAGAWPLWNGLGLGDDSKRGAFIGFRFRKKPPRLGLLVMIRMLLFWFLYDITDEKRKNIQAKLQELGL